MARARPRVLHVAPDLAAVSGISTHVVLLLRSPLASSAQLRHFQAGSEGRTESPLGLRWRLVTSPFRLLITVLLWRPDLVHVNTATERKALWRDAVFVELLRLAGRPVVLQVHGGPSPEVLRAQRPYSLRVLRRAMRRAHRVVVLGETDRALYQSVTPHAQIVVVPNAVAVRSTPPAPRHGLGGPGTLHLVFAGRLTAAKGLFEALDAVAQLRDDGVRLRWSVAGSGPDAEALRAAVRERHLEESVQLLGPVFGVAKQELFDNADVLLFPSYAEGLPYALLEALEAGLVVLTCPVGAIPDVVEDRRSALLVPPRDAGAVSAALRWVHDHRQEAQALADAGRLRVECHYSLERLAAQLVALYVDVLERPLSTGPASRRS